MKKIMSAYLKGYKKELVRINNVDIFTLVGTMVLHAIGGALIGAIVVYISNKLTKHEVIEINEEQEEVEE